jgi:hypothetical protein
MADPSEGTTLLMQMSFDVDATPATFHWTGFIASAKITAGREVIKLQSPWRLSSQFDLRRQRTWHCRVHDHDIKVVKASPILLAGVRKSSFTVAVDGAVVASAMGR